MYKQKSNAHTVPLCKKAGILPLEKLIIQAKLNFMHSIEYNYASSTFNTLFSKNISRETHHDLRNANDFIIPFARIETVKRLRLYSFPYTWNNEIGDLRFQQNKITFQIALKDHLLNQL